MSQRPKRNHHFVPKCLLKRWCDEHGMLWEYSGGENKVEHRHKDQAGMERDLYATGEGTDEPDYDGVEDALGKVENDAARSMELLLNHTTGLSIPTITRFLLFLAVQYMRSPAMRERIRGVTRPDEKKAKLTKNTIDNIRTGLLEKGAPADYIEQAMGATQRFTDSTLSPKDFLIFAALSQVDKVADEFVKLPWDFLLVPDGEPDLLIGDNPVILNDGDPGGGEPRALGLREPYVQVVMPMSPRLLAVGGFGSRADYGELLPGVVAGVNILTCRWAHRYVYSTTQSDAILTEAVAHFAKGPKWKIVTFVRPDGIIARRYEFR